MNVDRQIDPALQGNPLDLDGLEGLLDKAHLEITHNPDTSEVQLIRQLLTQLCNVTEIIQDTTQRLGAAKERLAVLAQLVAKQEKQMEAFSYYQTEAARAITLENELKIANDQILPLKRPLIKKMMFWTK